MAEENLRHPEDFYIRKLLNEVKIREVMVQKLITIKVDEPFSHVEEKMREFHIRHLPVVDYNNTLVGIVTQRDLYRIQSPRIDEENGNWFYDKLSLDNHILKNVMTTELFTMSPDDTIADALLHMVDRKYGCIPIVDKEGALCGIITQIDLLRLGAKILREH